MYTVEGNSVYSGSIRLSSFEDVAILLGSIDSGRRSNRVVKEMPDKDMVFFKNDVNKLVLLNVSDLRDVYTRTVIQKTKECTPIGSIANSINTDTTSIKDNINSSTINKPESESKIGMPTKKENVIEAKPAEEINIAKSLSFFSDYKVLTDAFEKIQDMKKFYYLNVAYVNGVNCALVVKLYEDYKIDNVYLLIELSILAKAGIVKEEVIKDYIDKMGSVDYIEYAKSVMTTLGVRFKADAMKVDINELIASNIAKNVSTPILSGIYNLPKLKSSKSVSSLDGTFESDIRLKQLKLLNLLSTSRSVMITKVAYNNMLEILEKEMSKDLSLYSIAMENSPEKNRYTKNYKEALVQMKTMVTTLFECYLRKKEIPVSLTSNVSKVRELVM